MTPIRVALIGTGNRAQTVYQPLFPSLRPWIEIVAVCDPVTEHAETFAQSIGVRPFTSLQDLIGWGKFDAAIVVTPIDSHHAISCTLSQAGIHHLVETSMTNSLVQARQMVATAKEHGVTLRIAENFFRFPFDRIARIVVESGVIGPVKRLTSFHDHLGFHNNSRWIKLFAAYPEQVQAISHRMPTAPHHQGGAYAHRFHEDERYEARFFSFPDNRLVVDIAGNIKGMLGRYPRPGYIEIDGARGALVQQAIGGWQSEAELRICSDHALANGGVADQVYPVVHANDGGTWASTSITLGEEHLEYVNELRPSGEQRLDRTYYGVAVMGHIVDFVDDIQGIAPSEYSAEDALMAITMERGAELSASRDGAIVELATVDGGEVDAAELTALRTRYGVDPLNVEAMLAISYPKP